jgi:two-component system cell cycle sensor histidine kinase/response regulator CckA
MATILIVEDDGIIAAHMEGLLTAQGYTVLPPVSSGEEAVAVAAEHAPDLILMDIQLAGDLDGIEAATRIQSRQDVPVVYLTAFTQDARLQQARATQPYAYLAKPVSGRELVATIETVLDRHMLVRRLKESESKYRTLVESIPGIAYSAEGEPPYRLIHLSERAFDLTGYPVEDFLSGRRRPFDIILPDDVPTARRALARALASRQPYDVHYRIRRADGEVRWLHDSGQFTFDDHGVPIRLDGVLLDITAQKQVEEQRDRALAALRQSEERYRRIVETAAEGISALDVRHRVTFANARLAEMLGYTVEEMLGLPVTQFYFPEDVAVQLERLARRQCGQGDRYEMRLRRKDGGAVWVSVSAVPITDDSGAFLGSFAMFTDITARREMEAERDAALAALRQRAGYLSALIESLPGTAWLKDTEGRFLVVNRAYAQLHGRASPEEVVGLRDSDILPAALAERFRAQDRLVMESGQTATFEEQREEAPGEVRWYETRKTPIRDATGAIVGTAGYAHDVTALHRAADERLALERRLLQAQQMESLTVLAGAVAHDFNNVLQSVLGNLDLVLLDPGLSPEAAQLVTTAVASARQAVDLVRQLLTFAGCDHFEWHAVDINRLVTDYLDAIRLVLPDHVTLDLHLAPDVPTIQADPDHLRRALMNLVTNAVEAIGEATGRVTLTTGVRHCDETYLRQSRLSEKPPAGDYVYLDVSDTGCGMDDATLLRLFDPFYTTKLAGRGLGLPAVLGIVRGHHGAIIVRSRRGRGTSVRLLFPLTQPVTPPRPAGDTTLRQPSPQPTPPERLVLVVDDDDNVRRVAANYLRRRGFEVLTASDGEVALRLAEEHAPRLACVLLDLTMPGLDSSEVFVRLRTLCPTLPIILSSGYTEAAALARFGGQQPTLFLEKPYRLEALRDTLERMLVPARG